MGPHRIERVAAFVDGFNLYHAIAELGAPHLKWVDLWRLAARFAAQPHQELKAVFYFSAFATWLPGPYKRHHAQKPGTDVSQLADITKGSTPPSPLLVLRPAAPV